MRLLLDTHVAVWSVSAPDRLSPTAAEAIPEADVVMVSVASLWEIAIKNNLGRQARDPLGLSVAEARQAFDDASFAVLPVGMAHLGVVESLPAIHRHPFDRMIVAVAQSESCRLVTHDRTLGEYDGDILLV